MTDAAILAGLLITLAGAALTVRQAARRMREIDPRSVEGVLDLAGQAMLFGGIAMMLLGDVALHVGRQPPLLSLIATALIVLVFGVQLGRLLMRWQIRHLLQN